MQKNRSKKQLIFEKWDHYENWQKWPPSKAYSLCKMVTLGQTFKIMQKKHAKNVSTRHCSCFVEKRLKKQLKSEKWDLFENWQKWPPSKGYNHNLWKMVTLGHKLKMQKNMLKTFLQQLIFEKWDQFENWQKWQPSKGKMVTLGQKLKMQKKHFKTSSRDIGNSPLSHGGHIILGDQKCCFTTPSLTPMVCGVLRGKTIKSYSGLPGRYGRHVRRAN